MSKKKGGGSTGTKPPAKGKGKGPQHQPQRAGAAPDKDDPANAPDGPAEGQGGQNITQAHQLEDPGPAPEGLPAAKGPPPKPASRAMADPLSAGGLVTNIPHVEGAPGRFKYTPPDEEEELDDGDEKDLDEVVAKLLEDPDKLGGGGSPGDLGRAAHAQAKRIVLAKKAAKKAGQEESKKKAGVTREEAQAKAAADEHRGEVYKGLDYLHNPRAYAKDPNNVADQTPGADTPAIDYRKIQDEEGRLRGNKPVTV